MIVMAIENAPSENQPNRSVVVPCAAARPPTQRETASCLTHYRGRLSRAASKTTSTTKSVAVYIGLWSTGLAPTGVTFREQSEIWLERSQNRKRNPIGESYTVTIQEALDKWILPAIGDLSLDSVDNLTIKPLVEKMWASILSAGTVNKYVEFVQQIVASLKGANGEPVHKRTWDAETMGLPIVEHSEQKRPSLKAEPISKLIQGSSSQEQALHVLPAATGMRVSEALALETRHFINNGCTIVVEQQVEKDAARIVQHLKTNAAKREIDLHPDIAEYLRKYMTGKKGLLFHTASGPPHLNGNLEARWLTPRLQEMECFSQASHPMFVRTIPSGIRDQSGFWATACPTGRLVRGQRRGYQPCLGAQSPWR